MLRNYDTKQKNKVRAITFKYLVKTLSKMDIYQESLDFHKKYKGKLQTTSPFSLKTKKDLSLAYTPGVAEPCRAIAKDPSKVYDYTIKSHTVAVISDGSAVLGLGNIGAEAGIPVMEGKCVLFKELAGLDAFPICVKTQDVDEIVTIVKNIAPVFGAVNLEDISAPRCFEVEAKLQDIGIPVMHDDQHGTAVVVLAALVNALKVVGKNFEDITVVVSGAGAAGTAITKMLVCGGISTKVCIPVKDVLLCDSHGIIHKKRTDLNGSKKELVKITNKSGKTGTFADAFKGADVFIGVSAPNIVTSDMIKSMAQHAIVFAMANPVPEIMPDAALSAGAMVVGTGRSDYPNQVNNALGFPGIFKGALEASAVRITPEMRHAAAYALAGSVVPTRDAILPSVLDKNVILKVADAVRKKAIEQDVVRK